jgi:hypothetical protein
MNYLTLMIITLGCFLHQRDEKKSPVNLAEYFESRPDSVSIDNKIIHLKAFLWRDFMPSSPPQGRDLKIVTYISTKGSAMLPANLDADSIWVIFNDQIWSAKLEHSGRKLPSETVKEMQKSASGGPSWGPGVEVTVLTRLIDNEGNKYYLKAAKQKIYRTE